ncbi:MAG: shikimate dehydrogenase [Methylobacterium sp.]|uniref:shikimate dehydrogenase n=1 Tax=Methylobacterium sp. TaxID=409 RepID=UPI0025D10571|nr:shikimate dehydrogenase [Methylobacterium sp.]MBX9933850.1 shikimate dehydrogenase [Methylobacterium sp.]
MIRAFVVGHPIAHSRSPLIHGHWLAELGIKGSYERVDVAPAHFAAFLTGLREHGFSGGNVTIPHKEAAFALADRLTPRARRIGAVNTLFFDETGQLTGDNTDAPGFIAHLDQSLGLDWPRRGDGSAVVLGAGGAARAIVVGLLDRGVASVHVANRTLTRATSLVALDSERVSALSWDGLDTVLPKAGLIVNTTSLGMAGHPSLDLDLRLLGADAVVADIVYVPLETPLIAAARTRGLATVDGLGMLLHQAVPGFERWFGRKPEVTPALRTRILSDLVPA